MSVTDVSTEGKIPPTAQKAVLQTLGFFSLFQRPLTLQELQAYLLYADLSEQEIEKIAATSEYISYQNGWYCLRGEEKIIASYAQQQETLQRRWRRVQRFMPLLRIIPFVRCVCVCNNLALDIAMPNGDIDLFIVTDAKHLYLARFLVTLVLQIFGVRRHGNKVRGRFCLSFYTTEDNLNFSHIALHPQDIYLAFWLVSLRPLFGKEVYDTILQENTAWLADYFDIAKIQRLWQERSSIIPYKKIMAKAIQEWFWQTSPGQWLEAKIVRLQKKRLARHHAQLADTSGTIISNQMLKFHNEDKRASYQNAWVKRISSFL